MTRKPVTQVLISLAMVVLTCVLLLTGCAPVETDTSQLEGTEPPTISIANVEAIDVTILAREWGDGYFFGFVKNFNSSPVGISTITLTIYDKADVIIAQEKRFVFMSLRPGERYPFSMWFSSEQLESYDRYEIALDTYQYYKGDEMLYPELNVINDRWEKGELITGTLQNTSQKTAQSVSICIAGYDNEGRLITVDRQTAGVSTIPAGMTATFKVNLLNGEPSKITNYEYFISARLED